MSTLICPEPAEAAEFLTAGFGAESLLEVHGSVHRYQCSTPCGALARPNVLALQALTSIDEALPEESRRR